MFRLVTVAVFAFSACRAVPAGWNQWGARDLHAPIVRAAPAFDDAFFAPVPVGPDPTNAGQDGQGNSVQPASDDGSYSFGYDVQGTGGGHSRQESRDSQGTVTGSYTIALADGRHRRVDYIADEAGFRAKVDTNEPGTDNQSPASVEWTSSAQQFYIGQPSIPPAQVTQPEPQRPVVVPGVDGVRPPGGQGQQPADQQTGNVRPPTHITARPPGSVTMLPAPTGQPDEPRTPHHPPGGFVPPNGRFQFAPLPSSWSQAPVVFASAPWGTYLNAYPSNVVYVQSAYPAVKRRY